MPDRIERQTFRTFNAFTPSSQKAGRSAYEPTPGEEQAQQTRYPTMNGMSADDKWGWLEEKMENDYKKRRGMLGVQPVSARAARHWSSRGWTSLRRPL